MSADHSTEIWRPVVGFEGVYSVSNMGRIRRDANDRLGRPWGGKILSGTTNAVGYRQVLLSNGPDIKKTRNVHTLVAEAFISARPKGMHVNHKNSNQLDNRVENLEWVTPLENIRHGLCRCRGRRAGRKLSPSDVMEVVRLARSGEPHRSISNRFGIRINMVSRIVCGNAWRWITNPIAAKAKYPDSPHGLLAQFLEEVDRL